MSRAAGTPADLLIVGGGINGVGIARDAAGRGLRVVLVERGDLGAQTSSASSKLVHGGLRYLEQLHLRLVSEALGEREVLLHAAPHIVRPMRFVMPHAPSLRPSWMIRTGLKLYDWLARRQTLPGSSGIDLRGCGLKSQYAKGYAYSDCWVDDARLVIANARSAAEHGARIMPRTAFASARTAEGRWRAVLVDKDGQSEIEARAIVNAAGPWVLGALAAAGRAPSDRVKLVQGSHIVVQRLYDGDQAYILQNDDGRVIFAYPYESEYTLIGTTEVELGPEPLACAVTVQEIDYLCGAVNRYFVRQIAPADVKWSYCGVRSLIDDGAASPSRLSRDYRLRLDAGRGSAPLLSVFGGKITTYRRLAERALEKLAPYFPQIGPPWTAEAHLKGGDLPDGSMDSLCRGLFTSYPALPHALVRALAERHGSCTAEVLGGAKTVEDLGESFGAHLYSREIDYFLAHEWAREPDDVLWRRTKAGLHLGAPERARVAAYVRKVGATA